jgi:hypothetical protein
VTRARVVAIVSRAKVDCPPFPFAFCSSEMVSFVIGCERDPVGLVVELEATVPLGAETGEIITNSPACSACKILTHSARQESDTYIKPRISSLDLPLGSFFLLQFSDSKIYFGNDPRI